MTSEEFRSLLHERGEVTPELGPEWQHELKGRIRKARHRRAAGAGVAALVAVAAVAAVLSVVPGEMSDTDTKPVSPTKATPKTFTDKDGVVYRRLTVAAVDLPVGKTTIKVPYSGKPLAVLGSCTPNDPSAWNDFDTNRELGALLIDVKGGTAGIFERELACAEPLDRPHEISHPVAGGKTVTITLGRFYTDGDSESKNYPARWTLGVYEWTPPARLTPPPPTPVLTGKDQKDEGRLLATKSGSWPAERKAKFTVTYRGKPITVMAKCTVPLGKNVTVRSRIGKDSTEEELFSCDPEGSPLVYATPQKIPRGAAQARVTVELAVGSTPAFLKRSASWTVGVYEER